jgi:PAS domain-containing protein
VETRDGLIVAVTVRDVTDRLHAEGLIVLVNSRAEQLFGYQSPGDRTSVVDLGFYTTRRNIKIVSGEPVGVRSRY